MPESSADIDANGAPRAQPFNAPGRALGLAALALIAVGVLYARNTAGPQAAPPAPQAPLDWLAVLVGPSHGTLEPCGCAGGMLGGIDRLATAVAVQRQSRSAPSLAIAAGGVLSEEARTSGILDWQRAQLDALFFSYGQMQIDAFGLSSQELGMPRSHLDAAKGYLGNVPIVATNVFDETGAPVFAPVHKDAASGVHVLCFVAPGRWSADSATARAADEGAGDGPVAWESLDPADAIARHAEAGIGIGEPGQRIALVEGDEVRAATVAALLAPSDVVVWFSGTGDASGQLVPVGPADALRPGGFLGERLRHVVTVRARGDTRQWERYGVEASLPADAALTAAREYYREFLAGSDVVGQFAGHLGPHPRGAFSGSASCASCHQDAHAIWGEGLHARAIETLHKDYRGVAQAIADPACVRCHSVGFGYATGFAAADAPGGPSRDALAVLAGVGCEACHGPGARHVVSALASDILRSDETTCMECHDADNDPNFDFKRKWPMIVHDEP